MKRIDYVSRFLIRSVFVLALALNSNCQAQNLTKELLITTEYSYPLNVSDDDGKTIYGVSADKVHELLKRSQIPYQMKMMSWNRAITLAQNQTDTCVFSTVRTKEREAKFKWIGPISDGPLGIFGTADKLGKISRLEEIKEAKVGVYMGDVSAEMLTEKGIGVITSYDNAQILKNLLGGRLDYWAASTRDAQSMISNMHAGDKLKLLFNFDNLDNYIACNIHVDDRVANLMRTKLKEMKEDGTFARINAKY